MSLYKLFEIIQTEDCARKFLRENKCLRTTVPTCLTCERKMSTLKDNWRCANRHRRVSFRQNSLFANSQESLRAHVIMLWSWSHKLRQSTFDEMIPDIRAGTFQKWSKLYRKICTRWLEENNYQIGGQEEIVDINTYSIGEERTRKGIKNIQTHFLVGFCITSQQGFIKVIKQKDSLEELEAAMRHYIRTGSVIQTKHWQRHQMPEYHVMPRPVKKPAPAIRYVGEDGPSAKRRKFKKRSSSFSSSITSSINQYDGAGDSSDEDQKEEEEKKKKNISESSSEEDEMNEVKVLPTKVFSTSPIEETSKNAKTFDVDDSDNDLSENEDDDEEKERSKTKANKKNGREDKDKFYNLKEESGDFHECTESLKSMKSIKTENLDDEDNDTSCTNVDDHNYSTNPEQVGQEKESTLSACYPGEILVSKNASVTITKRKREFHILPQYNKVPVVVQHMPNKPATSETVTAQPVKPVPLKNVDNAIQIQKKCLLQVLNKERLHPNQKYVLNFGQGARRQSEVQIQKPPEKTTDPQQKRKSTGMICLQLQPSNMVQTSPNFPKQLILTQQNSDKLRSLVAESAKKAMKKLPIPPSNPLPKELQEFYDELKKDAKRVEALKKLEKTKPPEPKLYVDESHKKKDLKKMEDIRDRVRTLNGFWIMFKHRSTNTVGISRDLLQSFCDEHSWRSVHGKSGTEAFQNILLHISQFYETP